MFAAQIMSNSVGGYICNVYVLYSELLFLMFLKLNFRKPTPICHKAMIVRDRQGPGHVIYNWFTWRGTFHH